MSRSASNPTSPCNIIGAYTPKTRALPFDAATRSKPEDLGRCSFACVWVTPCLRAGRCLDREAV